MDRIRAHPYLSAIIATVIVVLIGGFLVYRRSLATVSDTGRAWGGGSTLFNPASYVPERSNVTPLPDQSSANTHTIPPTPGASAQPTAAKGQTFDEFLRDLFGTQTKSNAPANTSIKSGDAIDPYSFIPTGLVSTSTFSSRSASQQALYDYGNNVGILIQTYESQNSGMVQVLKAQVEDRLDKPKAEAVRRLGRSLAGIGEGMKQFQDIPGSVQNAHTALANAYIEAGAKLALLPDAERDQEYVAAITAYNSSAEVLTQKYVALALIFSTAGVRFNQEDGGSVFTFVAN